VALVLLLWWKCNLEGRLGSVVVILVAFPSVLEVSLRDLMGPDDREDYGAVADDVDEQEDLVPGDPVLDEGAGFTNNNGGDVGEDLERDEDHGDLLFALLEEGFEEGPPSANENDDGEKEDDADELENVEEDVPAVRSASAFDVMLVLGGAEEVEGLHGRRAPIRRRIRWREWRLE